MPSTSSTVVSNSRATGKNSWLFQSASWVSETLRLGLLAYEAKRQIGNRIEVVIGAPLGPDALEEHRDHEALTSRLREETYALGR